MKIQEVTDYLDSRLLPYYQESWDNAGLQAGDSTQDISGALICLDVTPDVVDEAVARHCNLIVSHHPLLFSGVKRITPTTQTGRLLMHILQHNLCVYAAHTNLDNLCWGVSGELAKRIGLQNCHVLDPMPDKLKKLITYCPSAQAEAVRNALFEAGAGCIGGYDACSYNLQGTGTFRAGNDCHPFCGQRGELHLEPETRIEVIYESRIEAALVAALIAAHPYEEPAYDLLPITNAYSRIGAGAYGTLPRPVNTMEFLAQVKRTLHLPVIRCSQPCKTQVQRVALCGGSGAFLIDKAKRAAADIYLCGDLKYHEFQQAEGEIILADIGHYESEQFAKDIIYRVMSEKFCTFAVQTAQRDKGYIYYI